MIFRKTILTAVACMALAIPACGAGDGQWNMAMTYETPVLVNSPFFLIAATDLNKNGRKEVVAADFGEYGSQFNQWKQWREWPVKTYGMFVLEWNGGKLDLAWNKQWDVRKHRGDAFYDRLIAFKTQRMVPFTVGNRVVVETIPPYFGLEWVDGKYELHEQKGREGKEPLVGSWIFPWVSPSCYQGFVDRQTFPRECILAIRDFNRDGKPEVLTEKLEQLNRSDNKQILRIRSYQREFPILWEKTVTPDHYYGVMKPHDTYNVNAPSELMMYDVETNRNYLFRANYLSRLDKSRNFFFRQGNDRKDYDFIATGIKYFGIEEYDISGGYMRNTRDSNVNEVWGYIRLDSDSKEFWKYREKGDSKDNTTAFIMMLRRVKFNNDFSSVESKDIEFPHHKNFYGVGYFNLGDLDGDGLDELVLVEETAGRLKGDDEMLYFHEVKDYIRILKWDGKEYRTMWVSPPYTKRLTKFLIDDVKGTGRNQLVVLSPYGTVQIWEMKK